MYHWKLALSVALAGVPLMASAHAVGHSLEKLVNGYLVDIGYDRVEVVKGDMVNFSFGLIEHPGTFSWDFAPFTTVEMEISAPPELSFRKMLEATSYGPPVLAYTFAHTGPYELDVRYLQGKTVLAAARFPLQVRSSPTAQKSWIGFLVVAGVIGLLAIFGFVLSGRTNIRSRLRS